MTYTPQGWTNNAPPPIDADHLGAMDTGIVGAWGLAGAINAADDGAVGDNTTDDTAALTAWIGRINASTKGAYAFLPPGQYSVLSPLPTITQAGVTIVGAGFAQTAYTKGSCISARSGFSAETLMTWSGEGVSMRGVQLDGANRVGTSILGVSGANCRLFDSGVHGAKSGGACVDVLNGAISFWAMQNRINGINYTNHGIRVNDTDAILVGNKISNNSYCLTLLNGSSGTLFNDNHITPGASGINGILFDGSSGAAAHILIVGNRFDNYPNAAIQLNCGVASPNNWHIVNNVFQGIVQSDNVWPLIGIDTTSSSVRGLHVVGNSGYASAGHRPSGLISCITSGAAAPTNTSRLASMGSLVNSNNVWAAAFCPLGAPLVQRGNMLTTDGTTYAAVTDI